ncbi:MAG: aldolase [Anaerolineales bacterium]|nr:aldolase [Anaerolineales bacterium]
MEYTLADYAYDNDAFLPSTIFEKITEIRVDSPEIILKNAEERKRRSRLTVDGRLTILAADHPARGVTRIGNDPFKMGNRQEYLGRILRVLVASNFDGFMGTPDFIEDLLILDYLIKEGGGPSILDEKVLIGCMQRGGIAGVVGEIDDTFNAYTAKSIARFQLDGGKMMFRFVPDDERTLRTIQYCAQAVTNLNKHGTVPFVEPLRMDFHNGAWVSKNVADELVKLVGVVAGLGDSSIHKWIKIPYCEDFHRVAIATTLPILILGGASKENPEPIFSVVSSAMATRSNVRGTLVGRNVTFPGREDPGAVAQGIWEIVHQGMSIEDALETTMKSRDRDLDFLTSYIRR